MTPDSSLYRVGRKAIVWTLVVASSETHAKMVARKLPLSAFEAEGDDFDALEITDLEEIPAPWRGSVPWPEPGRENMYDDSSCEDIVRHATAQKKAVEEWNEEHPLS
jgi:hypothetical protein